MSHLLAVLESQAGIPKGLKKKTLQRGEVNDLGIQRAARGHGREE